MSKQTISFHLSSTIATERGNSNYELVLSPGLEIPHAAKDCTVYLHNLLFNNCLANVSGPLYQNNQVALTLSKEARQIARGQIGRRLRYALKNKGRL
jgi:hypothetical protein